MLMHYTAHDRIESGASAYIGVAPCKLVEVKQPLCAVLPVVELPQDHPQLILKAEMIKGKNIRRIFDEKYAVRVRNNKT